MKTGVELIAQERQRQIEQEGFTTEHDAQYEECTLELAAASYAVAENRRRKGMDSSAGMWPFDEEWYKPSPHFRLREMQKAGALIAAAMDRYIAMPWKVFRFSKQGYTYDIKAKTASEARYFLKIEHDIYITNSIELPQDELEKKFISVYPDNDTEQKPFLISLLEAFSSDETELLSTNDSSIVD